MGDRFWVNWFVVVWLKF